MTKLEILQSSGRNIFTADDLMVFWNEDNRRVVTESVKGYIRRGRLHTPRRGIYTLQKPHDEFELAQKIVNPSYISYYTALAKHGVIFQHYTDIHCMAVYGKKIEIDEKLYVYHQLKEEVLLNQTGLIQEKNYTIASAERAICDSLYINNSIAFDNLEGVNTKELINISKLYHNNRLERDVSKIVQQISKA